MRTSMQYPALEGLTGKYTTRKMTKLHPAPKLQIFYNLTREVIDTAKEHFSTHERRLQLQDTCRMCRS